jgi:hypothetical protein
MSEIAGEDDDAVRAFEALRVEVASLRQGIELVWRQGQQATAVDYSPTLGGIAKSLQAVERRLSEIERKPALHSTPDEYEQRMQAINRNAGQTIGQAADRAMRDGVEAQREATRALQAVTARARTAQEQRRWNAGFAVAGVFVGAALWYVLPSVLPWSAGDRLAASLIGGGPWQAGQALMQRASPESFDKMVQIYNACGDQRAEVCARDIAMALAEHALDEARTAETPAKARQGR